jgi:hypothetical protein
LFHAGFLLELCLLLVSCGFLSWPLLTTCFMLIPCLTYSSTLKIEATCSSEMLVKLQRTSQRYISEGRTLHTHQYEDVRSNSYIPSALGDMFIWKFLFHEVYLDS